MRATHIKNAAIACALSLCAFASAQVPPPPVSALDHSWIFPDPPTPQWFNGMTHYVTGPLTYSTTQTYTSHHRVTGSSANHPWNPEFATIVDTFYDTTKSASIDVPTGERRVREQWLAVIYHGSEGWKFSNSTTVNTREMSKVTLQSGVSFRLVLLD